MKKLIMAAAAITAGLAIADSSVVSSDIVGYTSKDAPQGKFQIIGAQFEGVGTDTMKINDIITSGVEGVNWDEDGLFTKTAAQIQVPRASGGYKTYYYLNDGVYADESEGKGWCDTEANIVDDEFTPGVAAWFKSVPGDGTATVSGAVSDESLKAVDCPVGFALRANTFPVAITLNTDAMTSDDIVGVLWDEDGLFTKTAPQIQVPRASGGYKTYYYLLDGVKADESEAAGWCDTEANIVDDEIPAGQGFWTKGVTGAFTLKFAK